MTDENIRTIDDVDFESLKLPEEYDDLVSVKNANLYYEVRRPHRHEFVRTHPDLVYNGLFFENKNDKEIYLIDVSVRDELLSLSELKLKRLYTYVNRDGDLKLWPVQLPGPDGKIDNFNLTARLAAELAKTKWVRIKAGSGKYIVDEAGLQMEPKWPEPVGEDNAMTKILKNAFRERFITSLDHPVIQKSVFGNL